MIRLRHVSFERFEIPLRRPFGFGIATLHALSHLRVRCAFDLPGGPAEGMTGENLAPKWFTKRPETTPEEDVAELLQAVEAARGLAMSLPPAVSPFDFWLSLYRVAGEELTAMPALLRQFAVSLFERCALDACCRRAGRPMWQLLRDDALGVRLGDVHAELAGTRPADWLGPPAASLAVRHTVGLADDLAELPGIARTDGHRRFKVKLSGNPTADLARLAEIDRALRSASPDESSMTLDGNENYPSVDALAEFVDRLPRDHPALAARVRWIEQPLHRQVALRPEVAPLTAARPHVALVLDESDDGLESLPAALDLGYRGSTHKNCKGVFKSVANACLLRKRFASAQRAGIYSGEDLTIVAPWSQAQDLAAAAAVGVVDVERNGQHYADGLSAFPPAEVERALRDHPLLYRRDADGVARPRVEGGAVRLDSVLAAPFGW